MDHRRRGTNVRVALHIYMFGPPTTVGHAVAVLPRPPWFVDRGSGNTVASFDDLDHFNRKAASDSEASGSTQGCLVHENFFLFRVL
jgi:hypothetical protein